MGYGSYREAIYVSTAPGTARNTFTAEAVGTLLNDVASMKSQARIPADFWGPYGNPAAAQGRGIHIFARGIISTTAAPTFNVNIRGGTASAITGPILLGTPAFTAGTGITNQVWELEGDIVLESTGVLSTTPNVRGVGQIRGPALAAPGSANAFGLAASPGLITTFDPTITNYINVSAVCGTSSASNAIQLLQLTIEAIN